MIHLSPGPAKASVAVALISLPRHAPCRRVTDASLVRPMGLRYKKAHVTHPTLGVTVMLPIIAVKKNPSNPLYTQLGVLSVSHHSLQINLDAY